MDLECARTLFPLLTEAGHKNLERIVQHPSAPAWTHSIGDHVVGSDIEATECFRRSCEGEHSVSPATPPPWLVKWVSTLRDPVEAFRQRIPEGFAIERDWVWLPTMRREDLASHPEALIPWDEPLERLIVYETSGTTGHALRVPHHPLAVAKLHVLAERALGWHGRQVLRGPNAVACMSLRAQASVWVYPCIFSVWEEAGFARLNLNERAWPGGVIAARRFVRGLDPGFLSSDPASFAEAMRWGLEASPAALLSTALGIPLPVKTALEGFYGCPVLDWYSTTETGPIACSKPGSAGLALLAPDLYVEVLDEEGLPVAEGARGEIVVSGGRNPYLPLLRYRTGDFARLVREPDASGVHEARLVDLEGRAAVMFRASDGSPVNPVDIGRVLRHHFAVLQHAFVQHADGSITATLRPAPNLPVDVANVEAELRGLFGSKLRVSVALDPGLAQAGKVVPYRSELTNDVYAPQ